jgi:hypothetical protein
MSNQLRNAHTPAYRKKARGSKRSARHSTRRPSAKSAYLSRREAEAQAAQWLWQSLVAITARAGQQSLDTDDLGYVLLEFALGVLALGYEKDELVEWLRLHIEAVEHGTHYTVNLGQRAQGYPVAQPRRRWHCMLNRTEDSLGTERWKSYSKELLDLIIFRPELS